MSDSEQRRFASEVAQEVLQKFFLTLGLDISTPAGVIEMQKDFHHIRAARQAIDAARTTMLNKVVNVLTGAVATAVIGGVGVWLAHH